MDVGVAAGMDVPPAPVDSVGLEVGEAGAVGMDVPPVPPEMVGPEVGAVVGDTSASPPQATSIKTMVANTVRSLNTFPMSWTRPSPNQIFEVLLSKSIGGS